MNHDSTIDWAAGPKYFIACIFSSLFNRAHYRVHSLVQESCYHGLVLIKGSFHPFSARAANPSILGQVCLARSRPILTYEATVKLMSELIWVEIWCDEKGGIHVGGGEAVTWALIKAAFASPPIYSGRGWPLPFCQHLNIEVYILHICLVNVLVVRCSSCRYRGGWEDRRRVLQSWCRLRYRWMRRVDLIVLGLDQVCSWRSVDALRCLHAFSIPHRVA